MMIKFLLTVILIIFIAVGIYTYQSSQKLFEAKFKNIDGLPQGASVTSLGIKVGEVTRTKPVNDGIIVTIRLTNKKFKKPLPGSQLTITSFRPNQGRVLEIIQSKEAVDENTAWVIQEPITTESWLHASIEILDKIKDASGVIIKNITPENFEKIRFALQDASGTLGKTKDKLQGYGDSLLEVKSRFQKKTNEANELLIRLKKPIESLNEIMKDENFALSAKADLSNFSADLASISKKITASEFASNLYSFKTNILDKLNQINSSLISYDETITNSDLKKKISDFNSHLTNLNVFYETLNSKPLKKITKEAIKKAKEATTNLEKQTSEW